MRSYGAKARLRLFIVMLNIMGSSERGGSRRSRLKNVFKVKTFREPGRKVVLSENQAEKWFFPRTRLSESRAENEVTLQAHIPHGSSHSLATHFKGTVRKAHTSHSTGVFLRQFTRNVYKHTHTPFHITHAHARAHTHTHTHAHTHT